MEDQEKEMEKIESRLKSLENRLARLESVLDRSEDAKSFREEEKIPKSGPFVITDTLDEEERDLESKIGRFGLAWMGNIVLLVGIIFMTQYLMIQGFRYISILIGYAAAGSIFYLANYLKKTNDHLAFMFRINALIIMFLITIRLHFFSSSPVIPNETISILLLLSLITFQVFFSIRNKSQAFAALSVLFAITTAILCDTTHLTLFITTLAAGLGTYYFFRFNWKTLLFTTIFLSYTAFFLWLFGNPFMGHQMQLISEHNYGVVYLFAIGFLFSLLLLLRTKDTTIDDFLIGVTFANGILFTFMLLIIVLRFFTTDYVSLFATISICCLIYSTLLHSRSEWNFGSAYYALYGFMAMSISLYGLVGYPHVYWLLSVQSLIVVSMALWFRNRLIVVMNSLLFMIILAVYLSTSKSITGVNFSFALISLLSARIINWKRYRLQIKTDLIRNLYMITGFFMVLYALAHGVPKHFITFSWTIAALLYFLLSILLRNIKYRYMALGTMICAAFYLFIVDLASIELIYRVLSLLCLAAISIGISMYYTNRMKKPDN
jgi:hypothetical protein